MHRELSGGRTRDEHRRDGEQPNSQAPTPHPCGGLLTLGCLGGHLIRGSALAAAPVTRGAGGAVRGRRQGGPLGVAPHAEHQAALCHPRDRRAHSRQSDRDPDQGVGSQGSHACKEYIGSPTNRVQASAAGVEPVWPSPSEGPRIGRGLRAVGRVVGSGASEYQPGPPDYRGRSTRARLESGFVYL